MSVCPVCSSTRSAPTHRERAHEYVRCEECDLVRLEPLPTPEEQARLHHAYLPETPLDQREFDLASREMWARARDRLVRRLGRGRILDVGCGNGTFLASMRTAGWDVTGVDVCPIGLARTTARGIRAVRGPLERAAIAPGSFEAVTAFHLIEHVSDPLGLLRACRDALRPGGTVYLRYPETTPLKDMLARLGVENALYDAPFHALDFSPPAMRTVLQTAGFGSIRLLGGGFTVPLRGRHRVLGFMLSALGDVVDHLTAGRRLLPGTSKVAMATRGL